MTEEEAKTIAGDLFGKVLLRNADKPGYQYVLERLKSGASPLNLFAEFTGSDEFREKFLVNDTPNEISRKTFSIVLGRQPSPQEVRAGAHVLLETGYRNFVAALIRGEPRLSGSRKIPDFRQYSALN